MWNFQHRLHSQLKWWRPVEVIAVKAKGIYIWPDRSPMLRKSTTHPDKCRLWRKQLKSRQAQLSAKTYSCITFMKETLSHLFFFFPRRKTFMDHIWRHIESQVVNSDLRLIKEPWIIPSLLFDPPPCHRLPRRLGEPFALASLDCLVSCREVSLHFHTRRTHQTAGFQQNKLQRWRSGCFYLLLICFNWPRCALDGLFWAM